MSDEQMVICPACRGKGNGWGFMCGPSGGRVGDIPCSTCNQTGRITTAHMMRIQQSKPMRRDRVERSVTLREEAARLGCGVGEWSRIEHGGMPETEGGARALAIRRAEVALLPPADTTEVKCPVCGYRYRGADATKLLNPVKTYACKGCGRSVVFERVATSENALS